MNKDRFKFRIWWESRQRYLDNRMFLLMDGRKIWSGMTFPVWDEEEDDYVVEFCTGLKDKNGNLIYEGDILECIYGYGSALFIKWRDSEARFAAVDDNVAYDLDDVVDGCEIIGNIHKIKGENND